MTENFLGQMKPPYSESPTDSKQDRRVTFTSNYLVVNLQDLEHKEKTLE